MNAILYRSHLALGSAALAAAVLALSGIGLAQAQTVSTVLTAQMSFGASGGNVTNLQRLLSTDSSIYPEALVTGYYGSLTTAAVQRFQCRENIVCSGSAATTGYGRVGPMTLTKLNAYIAAGGSIAGGGVPSNAYAPVIRNVSVSTAIAGSVTVAWATDKPSNGRVYYQVGFPTMIEATSPTSGFSVQSTSVAEIGSMVTSHSVTIPGLTSGQTYHYVVQSTDASGGVSLTWPSTVTVR